MCLNVPAHQKKGVMMLKPNALRSFVYEKSSPMPIRRDTDCLNKPSVKRPAARKGWTSVNLQKSILTEYCKTKDKVTLYKCCNLVSEYASHRACVRNPETFDYVLELYKWDCISTYMGNNKVDTPLHGSQPGCGEGVYITLWSKEPCPRLVSHSKEFWQDMTHWRREWH